jgi:hypothetical protein
MAEGEGYAGIERGEAACAGCAKALAGLPQAYAVLFPEGEGWRRRDYCAPCFEKLPERPTSYWRRDGALLEKAGGGAESGEARRARRRRDLDALLELFERLADPPEEKAADAGKLRYLLALALVRKKRVHLVDLAREGGADCLVIRTSGEAEVVSVPAPALSKEDMERLAQELAREVGLT